METPPGGVTNGLRGREKSFVVYGFGAGGTVERPGRSNKDAQQVCQFTVVYRIL